MHSGADSAGRNENSINTADCPTSAGLGTPWRWQRLLWIPQTPSGRGYLSSGAWSAGEGTAAPLFSGVWEGNLGHLSLTATYSLEGGLKKSFLCLSNKPKLPFLSSGFPEQLQPWMAVNGDFRHSFTSGGWGTAWAEDFRTQRNTSVLDDALFSTSVPLCFSCPDRVLHGKIRILMSKCFPKISTLPAFSFFFFSLNHCFIHNNFQIIHNNKIKWLLKWSKSLQIVHGANKLCF